MVVYPLSRSSDGFDLTDERSIEHAAGQFKIADIHFSLIIIASGMLDIPLDTANSKAQPTDPQNTHPPAAGPEKSFQSLNPAHTALAYAVNAIGPALVFKHFGPLMAPDAPAIFAALSARVGSIGDNALGGWMSYRASKAALNQFIRCASIEHQRRCPSHCVIALHPGTIETRLTRRYAKGRYTTSAAKAAEQMINTLQHLTPADSGGFFAYDGSPIVW